MNRFSVGQRRALSLIASLRLVRSLPTALHFTHSLLLLLQAVLLPTLFAQEPAPALTYLTGHQQGVYAVGYSPDGKTMISVGLDGTVRYWDRATGQPVFTQRVTNGPLLSLAVSPDGTSVAVGGADATVRLLDLARSYPTIDMPGLPGAATALARSADGQIVISGDAAGTVRLWDQKTKMAARDFPGAMAPISAVGLLTAPNQTVAIGGDGILRGWQLRDGQPLGGVVVLPAQDLATAPDDLRIAVAGQDGVVRLVDWPPVAVRPLVTHNDQAMSVAISRDGKWLVSGGLDQQVLLFGTADGKQVRALTGMGGKVAAVGISADGQRVAAGSDLGMVRLWNAADGMDAGTVAGHVGAISGIAWHPTKAQFATTGADGMIRVWNLPTPVSKWAGHTGAVSRGALDATGKVAVSVGADQIVRSWDTAAGKQVAAMEKTDAVVTELAVTRDGQQILAGDIQGQLRRWTAADGKALSTLGAHLGPVSAIASDPTGKRVITTGHDGLVKWWDSTNTAPVTLPGLAEPAAALALAPGGKQLAVALADGSIAILNASSGQVIHKLAGSGAPVALLKWSPDPKLLVAGDRTGRVTFWNVVEGREQSWVGGHEGAVQTVAWSAKEPLWATAGADGVIRVWRNPVAPLTLIAAPKAAPAAAPAANAAAPAAPTAAPPAVAAAPDGQLVAAGLSDGSVQIFSTSDGKLKGQLAAPAIPPAVNPPAAKPDGQPAANPAGNAAANAGAVGRRVLSVAWRRDQAELAAGDAQGAIRLAGPDGQSTGTLLGHDGPVTTLQYNAAGQQLVSGSADGLVKTWQLPLVPGANLQQHQAGTLALVVSGDANKLFSVGTDQALQGYDLVTGQAVFAPQKLPAPLTSLALTTDNNLLLAGDAQGLVRVHAVADGAAQFAFGGHVGGVRGVAVKPQGGQVATIGADGDLRLWDAPTAARVLTGHTAAVTLFAVSPNGQQLVTSGADQSARVWNLADGAASWTFPHAAAISALAWRGDGAQLATGSANKQLLIWSTADGQKVQAFDGHTAAITAVTFLPDNSVAAACADGHVKIWNVAEKKEVADLVAHDQAISSLHLIPGGQQLAVVTANGNLKTFQISDRKPLQSIALGAPVLAAATSADGKLLVTLGQDKQLRVITTADLKITATIPVNAADVTSVSIANDGQRLALGTTTGLLRVLGPDGKPIESLDLGPTKTNGVGFVVDQKTLVVASDDPRVRLVRPGLQKSIHVADKPLTSLAYTPDGAAVVVSGEGQGVTIWNLTTGQALRTIAAADSALDLVLSPDGAKCYTVHADQSVKGWQVADGAAIGVWPQPERIRRVRLSRDGSRLLLGGEAGAARVLETATGRLLERFTLPTGMLGGIALLPDNRTLVTAAADGQVRRHTLAALVVVAQHPGGVLSVNYSANSQSVLSCGADKGARISDLNGKVMVTLQGADTVLNALALRGDGSQIVGLGQDQQLYIWPNGNGQLERKVPLGVVPTSVCYATDGTRVTLTAADGQLRTVQVADGKLVERRAVVAGNATLAALPAMAANGNQPAIPERFLVGGADGSVALHTPLLVRSLVGHMGVVSGVAFSSDGTSLLSGGADKTVRVWALATGQAARTFAGPTDAVTGLALSADGTRVFAAGADKSVRVWNYADGAAVATVTLPTAIRQLHSGADANHCVTVGDDQVVRVWQVLTGRQLEAFTSPQAAGAVVAAADGSTSEPGERIVAWASADKSLRVARVSAQQVIVGDVGKVHSAVLFPDGKLLATCGDDRVIKLWNADGTLARQLGGSPVAWRRLAVTGDGALLAAGGDVAGAQPLVHLWKTADGQALPTITTPVPVVAIALASDGRLAVAGNDQHVRIYSIADQRLLQDITVPAAITDLAIAADGSALIVTSADQHVYRYGLALERLLAGHQGAVTGVSFAPDGSSLFTAGADKTIRQWDLRDGQTVRLFTGATAGVNSLTLSGDGRTLAASAADNQLRCWAVDPWPAAAKPDAAKPDATKPAPAAAPVVPVNVVPQAAWASPAAVRAVSLSHDGQRLAATSDDSLIRVWDRVAMKEMQRFAGHAGVIHAVSFASDGRSLATAGADKTVQWWTLSVAQIAVAHEGAVHSIRYSRDGKRIYTAGADKAVRQWDAATLAKGREYLGAEAAVKCLAVSSDELTLAAGGDDLAVRLWTIADGQSQGVIKLPTAISSLALAGQAADRRVVVASADAIVRTFAREMPAANAATNAAATNAAATNAAATNAAAKPEPLGTWQLLLESRGHTAAVTRLQLTADERSLFTASVDQTVRRWQIPSLASRWQGKASEQPVYGVAFSPDGSRLAVAGGDGAVQMLQAADGMAIWSKREHAGAVQAVAFHPGGKELVSAGVDGKLRFWDEQGQVLKSGAAEAAGRLLTVAYSPDGNQVLTAGSGKIWQSLVRETLAVGRTGVGHNDTIYRLSYNPAGSRLATLDYGGHLFIWDMSTGNLLHHQQLPVTAAFGLAYAPDGTELLIASRDARVLRWSIPAAVR